MADASKKQLNLLSKAIYEAKESARRSSLFLKDYADSIIAEKSDDAKKIEGALDSILGVMAFGYCKEDFMNLLRYYAKINLEAANYYHDFALDNGLLSKARHLDEVRSLDLPPEGYVLFGSLPMAIRGIRPNKDIDLVVTDEVYKSIESLFTRDSVGRLRRGNIELFKDWENTYIEKGFLINNSETIGEFRYVKLPCILEWKMHGTRKKDMEDVKMIKEYLSVWRH